MARVVAIVGSCRRGGITDTAVDAVLEGARQAGADTKKIFLLDQHIEFCRNCRKCAQPDGVERGRCELKDDLNQILDEVEQADGLVLAAPVNFFNVTAVFRQFLERLLGYSYWPWGSRYGPVLRRKQATKKAVLVTSAGMPASWIPWMTGAPRALKIAARVLGARTVGRIWIGQVPAEEHPRLQLRYRRRAVELGTKLA